MVLAALFGGNLLRGWFLQKEVKAAALVTAGITSAEVMDKTSVGVEIGQAACLEPVELMAVSMDNVQAAAEEPGIAVPEYIVKLTEEIGQAYAISPELLQAIAWRESRFDPEAVNAARTCFGLMQVSAKWHSHRLTDGEDIMDPVVNIRLAAEYLVELFERYEDPALVLMIYNGDSRAFEEGYISGYAREVMELAEELEKQEKNMEKKRGMP